MKRQNIAGISMKGGRRDNFYLCLVEYFPTEKRWFLSSLLKVKDTKIQQSNATSLYGDAVIEEWIERYSLHDLVVDIPLSYPIYHRLNNEITQDGKDNLNIVFKIIEMMLKSDQEIKRKNPKEYEYERNEDDLIDLSKDILEKLPSDHLISRSFRRRLKKGFLPYWNRPLDLWIWMNYYDQLLKVFNVSYDSFGNTSLMNLFRFDYLKASFPDDLNLYEGNFYITMLELLRARVIERKDLVNLFDFDLCVDARSSIIKKIEKRLNVFIYEPDIEILIQKPRAFESFLLSVVGKNIHLGMTYSLPSWTQPEETNFKIPFFQ